VSGKSGAVQGWTRTRTAVTENLMGFMAYAYHLPAVKGLCLLEPQPAQPEDCALASWFGQSGRATGILKMDSEGDGVLLRP
jgi:hypothetical protein